MLSWETNNGKESNVCIGCDVGIGQCVFNSDNHKEKKWPFLCLKNIFCFLNILLLHDVFLFLDENVVV